MAINKVVLGERTLIDLSLDTATEADVAKGKYFHRADGELVEGTLEGSGGGGGGGGGEGGGLVESDVNFYDYDGTLLYAYPRAGVMAMTELPAPPEHRGLTFQEWNWTLKEIQAHNREVNVGACYITDDGKTRLYITIEAMALADVSLYFDVSMGGDTVVINWGDGTGDDTYEIEAYNNGDARPGNPRTFSHTYAAIGDYVITISSGEQLRLGYRTYSLFYEKDTSSAVYKSSILRRIELGGNIAAIGADSMRFCTKLETITMTKDVGRESKSGSTPYYFYGCTSLKSITVPRKDPHFANAKNLFTLSSRLKSILLPGTLKVIGEGMANGCRLLSNITIPDAVINARTECFRDTGLSSIIFPQTVTIIPQSAFQGCYNLQEIVAKGVTKVNDSAFYQCLTLRHVEFSDNLTSIGTSAFYYCKVLENIDLTDSLTSIGTSAFNGCQNLSSIHLPDSVQSIGTSAFSGCNTLVSANIPDGVPSVGSGTFSGCYTLDHLDIPPSVTSIGTTAFNNCLSLKYIDFSRHTAVPTLAGTNAFSGTASTLEIRVPAALYDEWIAATNWSSVASKIVAV